MDGCREGSLIDEASGTNPDDVAEARMDTVLTAAGITCASCATASITGSIPEKTLVCEATIPYTAITGATVGYALPNVIPSTITSRTQSRLEWQR